MNEKKIQLLSSHWSNIVDIFVQYFPTSHRKKISAKAPYRLVDDNEKLFINIIKAYNDQEFDDICRYIELIIWYRPKHVDDGYTKTWDVMRELLK